MPQAAIGSRAASFPNARLLWMRRSGHLIQVEERAAFFAAIETFLSGGWPAGAETISPR